MTPSELTTRVTVWTAAALVPLALVGAWVAGAAGGVGVLAGGALALGDFRWLAARIVAVAAPGARAGWAAASALRLGALAVLGGILLARGWAHPVALVLGLSVLPFSVVAQGLAAARRESRS